MIDFQKDVIDRSYEKPVVVDFWAPWCGPCRVLGPVIEQLAEEQKDQWELVKLNTEEHEDVASQYMIRSIPNVKLFYRGEVIDEFQGSIPRTLILEWLKKTIPTPGLMALDHLLATTEVPTSEELEKLSSSYPESPEIRIVLGQLLLWDLPHRASEVLEPIRMGTPFYNEASYLRDISAFLLMDTEDEELLRIRQLLSESHLEEAIPQIIQALSRNNKTGEGKLSKAAIGIFNTLGMHHPLSKTYRKQLDMVLWV